MIDRDELQDAKDLLEEIREKYEALKDFFRDNKKDCNWDGLRAYNFGHIEPALFIEHEWVGEQDSLEQELDDMEEALEEQETELTDLAADWAKNNQNASDDDVDDYVNETGEDKNGREFLFTAISDALAAQRKKEAL